MADYGNSKGFQYQDSGSQGSTGWSGDYGGTAQDWGGGQGGTSQGLANIQAQAAEAQAIVNAQAAAEKAAAEKAAAEKAAAEKAAAEKAAAENKKRGIFETYGHGEVIEDYIGDTAWKAKYNTGQHKLRSQFDRLIAKYGKNFANTTQGKQLANYLSRVAVERGGGLGARDETYGGGPTENINAEMEDDRQWLLEQMASGKSKQAGFYWNWENITQEEFGKDLTEDQWFNFRQQLMAADPSPGNVDYKEALPWSSGQAMGNLAKPALSMAKEIGKGLLGIIPPEVKTMGKDLFDAAGNLIPEDAKIMGRDIFDAAGNLIPEDAKTMLRDFREGIGGLFDTKPEWADWKDYQQIFKDTSVPEYGGESGGGAGIAGLPGIPPDLVQQPDTILPPPDDATFKPGVDPNNPWGIPSPYAGFYDSPFNIPNPGASPTVVTPVTLPSGEVINFGNPYIADQFQQYMASQTQTTPTPFDYSQWPQYGPAGGPVPNYVNQGLGQGPHFDYWNQIARTFPGMT